MEVNRIFCDHCSDSILGTPVKVKEHGKRHFVFCEGCTMMMDKRGIVVLRGRRYRLRNR